MSQYIKMIAENEFESTIKTGVILVDFYADWCGPCKTITPHLEAVAKELEGKASIIKIDVDSSQQVASKYQVTSIPTLILFNNGKEVDRIVGVRNAKDIKEFILTVAK
ncbi:MAG: thioredoxin [Rhabdochlamydiaceae bacterium]